MFESIKNFFRRRKIRKLSKAVPTGLIPMSEVSAVSVVLDVEDSEWDGLKEEIIEWGRSNGIKINILFFDLRKLAKGELMFTSIKDTVTRKDINWLGMSRYKKIAGFMAEPCDLFISLIDNGEFAIDFIAKCSCARFKIGRRAYPGHAFDMICYGRPTNGMNPGGRQVFGGIIEFIGKISA